MKTITVRELHARTGDWLRQAARHGEIHVTDRGLRIAKILPDSAPVEAPYFSRRKLAPAFRKLSASGKLRAGTDSTRAISEDREDREL